MDNSNKKELAVMIEYSVFEVQPNSTDFTKENGWQFAKLIWTFAVKHDGRHKARLFIGGHNTIADEFDTYASTVRPENFRLQLYLAAKEGMNMISGDIGSASMPTQKRKYGPD